MKSSFYKWTSVILISFTIMFQYACNEPQSVEQQTKTQNSSRLSLDNLTGAIFTTDNTCSGVNFNIYENKGDVYLNGGPAHPGAAGLPDGYYYCQVTDPSGAVLLGTSLGLQDSLPIHVTNGEFDQCYQLEAILRTGSNNTPPYTTGYDNTPNSGGEYKVWVSSVRNFDPDLSKTDNFKVISGSLPPRAELQVIKFYDANVNGINDDNQNLTGWKVEITDGFDYIRYTPVSLTVEPGSYTVAEFTPIETSWMHTTSTSVTLTITDGGTGLAEFGNVCLGAGGGLTLGFWSNKNGMALIDGSDLSMLSGLNLRNANGSDFNPSTYAEFRTWLLSATATNMAYMLSAQLAAMELNVFNGKVSGNALVYAPGVNGANSLGFITINALMNEANSSLGSNGYTVDSGTIRTYQEALKNALDNANNNKTFVQSTPCPFTFQ